ncbi:unnamed protein product [Caretta caretta]
MDAEDAMKQDAEQPPDTASLVEGVRTLLRSLEVRQQCLLANIASCDELMAEITSLQAALCTPARTEGSSLPVQQENKNS